MATIDGGASALTDDGEFIIRSGRDAQALQLRLDQYRKRRRGGSDRPRPNTCAKGTTSRENEGDHIFSLTGLPKSRAG